MNTQDLIELDRRAIEIQTVFKCLYPLLIQNSKSGNLELDDIYGDVLIILNSGTRRVAGLDFWQNIVSHFDFWGIELCPDSKHRQVTKQPKLSLNKKTTKGVKRYG